MPVEHQGKEREKTIKRRVKLERGPEVAKEVLTFSPLECTDEVEDFVVLLYSRSYVSDTL